MPHEEEKEIQHSAEKRHIGDDRSMNIDEPQKSAFRRNDPFASARNSKRKSDNEDEETFMRL